MPDGTAAALGATALGLALWTASASIVQVLVYRAALRAWPAAAAPDAPAAPPPPPPAPRPDAVGPPPPLPSRPRYDPRALALAALVAFGVLLATTNWVVLGAVSAWLALAWLTARADPAPVRAGLALAALLGGGALVFGLIGGMAVELTLQRALRATLLVLVATWLRAAAGEAGVREIARRSLRTVRRVPAMTEAAQLLDRLGSGWRARRLGPRPRRAGPRRPAPAGSARTGGAGMDRHGGRAIPGPAAGTARWRRCARAGTIGHLSSA